MVLDAVVAGSIVAGTAVGVVFEVKRWMRNEEQRRAEAEQRRAEAEERREARWLAREEKRDAKHEADMQSLRADAKERDDRLCAAISAIGEKVDGLSVRVARLEGEFRSFRDFVRPIVQSLARPDHARRAGPSGEGEQPAAGPGLDGLPEGKSISDSGEGEQPAAGPR